MKLQTFVENQFIGTNLNRYDVFVRCLAIDHFYKKNDYGFDIYNKMQQIRVGTTNKFEQNFKELIKSFEQKGFDPKYPIQTWKNVIKEGAHRAACSIHFNIDDVPIEDQIKSPIQYNKQWFEKNFSSNDIKRIEDKRIEIFREHGLYLHCILWNCMEPWFDDIEHELKKTYNVIGSKTVSMNADFIRKVYEIDDISSERIEMKIKGMHGRGELMRIIELDIPNPKWRNKAANGKLLSTVGESIKKKYRQEYMPKIKNYYHDIIIHTGDNFDHTRHIKKAFDETYS